MQWHLYSPLAYWRRGHRRPSRSKGPAAKGIITEPSIVRESKLPNLPINPRQIEYLIDNPHVMLALAHLYAPFLDNYGVKIRSDHVVHIDEQGTLAGDAELIDIRPGRRVTLCPDITTFSTCGSTGMWSW